MKVPATALAALLLVAICSPAKAQRSDSGIAASSQKTDALAITCCFAYARRLIRRSNIISAYETSSMCSQPAVILVTNRGNKICADPKARWVQNYLKQFQILEH